jgi:AbrB family looped-hinge helix DNA binding protein
MAKVTSKLQVTLPKAVADRYGIHPGDEIEWVPAGEVIRVVPASARAPRLDLETRLRLFDEATERQRRRETERRKEQEPSDRGWTREELYDRGHSRTDDSNRR